METKQQKQIKSLLKIELSTPTILNQGTKIERTEWKLPNGKLHREFGPAVYFPDGTEEWYKDGENHRVGGPAYVHADGTKMWWVEGKCHREDGPAVIVLIEDKEHVQYWIHGTRASLDNFQAWQRDNKESKS